MRSPGADAARRAGIPADHEPVAGALPDTSGFLRGGGRTVCSPAARAQVPGAACDPRLRPWDLGDWSGRPLAQLPVEELAAWRSNPDWAGHGGESLRDVTARVAGLLADWHDTDGRLAAVTHAAVVRAAVLLALRAPVEAAWDLDVRPGSGTELHSTTTGWRVVTVGAPLGAA